MNKDFSNWLTSQGITEMDLDSYYTAMSAFEGGQKSKMSEIELLSERCSQLLKDKGELTDRVKELEAQIEKMKCCGNCDWKVKGICNDNDNCELKDWKLVETWR